MSGVSPQSPSVGPCIPPVAACLPRPSWSVMIPTYDPRADYLEETLRCVLQQDPGPEEMQIEVIDDCSPKGAPSDLLHRVAGSRISLHLEPKNQGLAGTWNRCIERARGKWVHILHQDDVVLPGFYEHLGTALRLHPEVGAAFCRHIYMDEDGHWTSISDLERRTAGILEDWLDRIGERQAIQCPSIVVRRDVYEALGGFYEGLCYALDWEMWKRIATVYPTWFEPKPLACYRIHSGSWSAHLARNGETRADVLKCIEISREYLPRDRVVAISKRARETVSLQALQTADCLLGQGSAWAAILLLCESLRASHSWRVLRSATRLVFGMTKYSILRIVRGISSSFGRDSRDQGRRAG